MTTIFDDFRDDVRWWFSIRVLFYPGWWRSLPRCQPRPIPFPRGSSVFLMGIVYTFGTRLKRGGDGHGGVRPRHSSYPTWTIYIPPTIWRFPFGDDHPWQLIFPTLIFIPHIGDSHWWRTSMIFVLVWIITNVISHSMIVIDNSYSAFIHVYSTNKSRLIPFQLQYLWW